MADLRRQKENVSKFEDMSIDTLQSVEQELKNKEK